MDLPQNRSIGNDRSGILSSSITVTTIDAHHTTKSCARKRATLIVFCRAHIRKGRVIYHYEFLDSRHTGGKKNKKTKIRKNAPSRICLACRMIWSVEELETLRAGTKPRALYHIIARLEERGAERGTHDVIPSKDERRPSSIRPTLKPFQMQHWGNFRETAGAFT